MDLRDAVGLAQQAANNSGEPWYVYELARRRWRRQWTFSRDLPFDISEYRTFQRTPSSTPEVTELARGSASAARTRVNIWTIANLTQYIGAASMAEACVVGIMEWRLPLLVLLAMPGLAWCVLWSTGNKYLKIARHAWSSGAQMEYATWLEGLKHCFVFTNLAAIGMGCFASGSFTLKYLPFSIPLCWGLGLIVIGAPPKNF